MAISKSSKVPISGGVNTFHKSPKLKNSPNPVMGGREVISTLDQLFSLESFHYEPTLSNLFVHIWKQGPHSAKFKYSCMEVLSSGLGVQCLD